MTSPLLRKPRTTAPWKRAARAASLALLLAATTVPALAQNPAKSPSGGKTVYFQKPADGTLPVAGGGTEVAAWATQPPLPGGAGQPKAPVPPDLGIDIKKATQLPTRDKIFSIPDDATLEQVILSRLREDERAAGRAPYLKYGPDLRPPDSPASAAAWLRGYLQYGLPVQFPPLPDVSGGIAYKPKTGSYTPMQEYYDALYVVHRRLHFEERNAERYGWDLGIIQPFVSTMYFYKDVLLWPNSLASGCAYGFWDTNAGKCLPGSPTPYFLYPPGLTVTGGAVEGAVITGAAFIIP